MTEYDFGYRNGYDDAIEKACKVLNRYLGKSVPTHNARFDVDFYYSKQEFIDLFKQAMEE